MKAKALLVVCVLLSAGCASLLEPSPTTGISPLQEIVQAGAEGAAAGTAGGPGGMVTGGVVAAGLALVALYLRRRGKAGAGVR